MENFFGYDISIYPYNVVRRYGFRFASNVVLSAECSFCRNASTMLAT